MSLYKRKYGEEQPYWPIGSYKLRLPLIHYRLEIPELIQGVVLFTAGLGMIEIMTSVMGISYEAALTITILNQFLMLLPSTFGVPMIAGFITPLVPLIVVFLGDYAPGPEAVQAVIAVQIVLALIYLLFGFTGFGEKVIINLPVSLKAGILIGAGIAAIMSEIEPGGRLAETPIAITVGGLLCLYTMFSPQFKGLALRNRFVRIIANYGVVTAILGAILVGWIVGEYPTPNIEWGITIPALSEVWQLTPWVIGFPGIEMLIAAIPTAILAYIIAYGDIIVADQMIKRASESRKDEKITYNLGQLHVITGIRNVLNALFAPHPGMSGPIYAPGIASVTERYKKGPKAMESIYSGSNTMLIAFSIGIFLLPLVTFFRPFLPIALSITMILTGYLAITIGMQQVKTEAQMGVAGIMAIVLAVYGAAAALILGVILYFIIEKSGRKNKHMEKEETTKEVG